MIYQLYQAIEAKEKGGVRNRRPLYSDEINIEKQEYALSTTSYFIVVVDPALSRDLAAICISAQPALSALIQFNNTNILYHYKLCNVVGNSIQSTLIGIQSVIGRR